MPGLGTIINVLAIIAGGIIGIISGKFIKDSIRDSLIKVCGVTTLFVAIGGAMSKMIVITDGKLSTQGSLMMILSLVIGTVIGEIICIEDGLDRFGEWLKIKSGNAKEQEFVNAFVTASLTVCVGAMAVVGSIQDAIALDPSILIAKAILDFTIIIIMTASMGKGAIFSAVSVGLFQGSITVLARIIAPFMTEQALSNLSFVGSVMIFCVGVNLIWEKKFRVGNMLPGLIIAVIFAFFGVQ